MASTTERILGLLRGLADAFFKPGKTATPTRRAPNAKSGARPASPGSATGLRSPYPGDFNGTSKVLYAPKPDGVPDPGEIVWTWVPYEEDFSQGKDRPVLLVGREGARLLALMLTSKDHSADRRADNDYIDIGPGAWDRQGRPSEVKLDRILQVSPADMRREGAVLDARRFGAVASGLRQRHGWK
ncbi:type II toxin-antitoxin system PemK/MazF family toxin [Arthrobacter sp. GMC3]|uniref:type II toxin-antitoxin system PemK/MazF family toxin n=1 Tax=Arthrobacter sp. GMC3 TaxID=2058894 RepID=UPI000CE2BF7A|nr:type II toxin-antitoxin system PemK/MazF family toxin [Arthrobacter sp. GMC3]